MKIIATVGDGTFIAKLDLQEIDYLAGKKLGENGYYSYDRKIPSGTEFNIVEAFAQIHRNQRRKDQVETLRQTLNLMLAGLDMAKPLIEEPQVEELNAEAK